MWPVSAVVGENGGCYFGLDRQTRAMRREFWLSAGERLDDQLALGARLVRQFRQALDVAAHGARCLRRGSREREAVLYIGDSLNDEPMFRSVGVSTVASCLDRLKAPPRYVTTGAGGAGFVELADGLLAAR
jgi:hypothetical protein